jgi:hypothetical protein
LLELLRTGPSGGTREEAEMLSKCATPGCPATFLYLHQGKLFRLDTSVEILAHIPVREVTSPSSCVEFFWLCDQCAEVLALGYNKGTGITVVPPAKELARAQTASGRVPSPARELITWARASSLVLQRP